MLANVGILAKVTDAVSADAGEIISEEFVAGKIAAD
jgi:hypothetical protein